MEPLESNWISHNLPMTEYETIRTQQRSHYQTENGGAVAEILEVIT